MTIASEHEVSLLAISASIAQNTGEEHMIADHGDTIATGAQLDELVGGGITALHDYTGVTPYVDRGDPAAWDYSKVDFLTDGAWHTLDLSAIVPQGATLVHLKIKALTAFNNSIIAFCKNDIINKLNGATIAIRHGASDYYEEAWVACDADRKIEYWTSNQTWVILDLMVRGWG